MTTALTEFLVVLICNERTVYIDRWLPAECLIEAIVLRRGRQIFISSDHMGNIHQMIVNHIGKIVGWITVRLDQNHIVKLRVIDRDISVNLIVERRSSFGRHINADHIWLPFCKIRLNFLFAKGQAMLVVDTDLCSAFGNSGLQAVQTFLVTETVISVSLLDELLCILQVKAALISLALYIRTITPVFIRTLIVDKSCLL